MRVSKLALLICSLFAGSFALATTPNMRSFVKLHTSHGHGSIFLKYDYTGEPVLAPASITIRIFCEGEAQPRRDLIIPACSLDTHEFLPDMGELSLSYTQGIVHGPKVSCKIKKQDELALVKICRKKSP